MNEVDRWVTLPAAVAEKGSQLYVLSLSAPLRQPASLDGVGVILWREIHASGLRGITLDELAGEFEGGDHDQLIADLSAFLRSLEEHALVQRIQSRDENPV